MVRSGIGELSLSDVGVGIRDEFNGDFGFRGRALDVLDGSSALFVGVFRLRRGLVFSERIVYYDPLDFFLRDISHNRLRLPMALTDWTYTSRLKKKKSSNCVGANREPEDAPHGEAEAMEENICLQASEPCTCPEVPAATCFASRPSSIVMPW